MACSTRKARNCSSLINHWRNSPGPIAPGEETKSWWGRKRSDEEVGGEKVRWRKGKMAKAEKAATVDLSDSSSPLGPIAPGNSPFRGKHHRGHSPQKRGPEGSPPEVSLRGQTNPQTGRRPHLLRWGFHPQVNPCFPKHTSRPRMMTRPALRRTSRPPFPKDSQFPEEPPLIVH
ncbi:hypothetical protein GWK47_046420 [Chionoecetes opilio]|uniref:Uncharacterized protein n=1 Tax=Chionoecetes opilio TaxID=41210 RepID=A0A8J4YC35_CHIOP|nr:hypothetical protein GWK47_046420 [Chionoecetes opilio]